MKLAPYYLKLYKDKSNAGQAYKNGIWSKSDLSGCGWTMEALYPNANKLNVFMIAYLLQLKSKAICSYVNFSAMSSAPGLFKAKYSVSYHSSWIIGLWSNKRKM